MSRVNLLPFRIFGGALVPKPVVVTGHELVFVVSYSKLAPDLKLHQIFYGSYARPASLMTKILT